MSKNKKPTRQTRIIQIVLLAFLSLLLIMKYKDFLFSSRRLQYIDTGPDIERPTLNVDKGHIDQILQNQGR